MAFYETKLDPYIPVNPNIDIPAEFLQAEATRLQAAYDKSILASQKATEDSYVQRGVTSQPAADAWNTKYSEQFMDIGNRLRNAQISSKQAKDEIAALQTTMNTERPMFDVLRKLSSEEAWNRGYAEQKAALDSSNTALTPNFDENTGQFDQQTDLAKLESSYRNLGLTVNPTDWSRIFREQAMSAIVKETTNIDPTSEIIYRDVENDSGGIDRVPFLRTKDGKETRYTRDLIERDLDLNNEALFDQLYKSSRSWGVPHYFATELAGLSEAEARAKFKKDIIQSTTGNWRSIKDENVRETKVTGVGGGKKKKGSGDEEGGDKAVAGVGQAIAIPGVKNPATGQTFKPEEINPRTASTLPGAMKGQVTNQSLVALGGFNNQFPGHGTIQMDPEIGIPQLIPAPGMQWSTAMKASAEMYNMALQDIAAQTEGISEMNRDILIEAYGTGDLTPLEQTRALIQDPYREFGYETMANKDISLLNYTKHSTSDLTKYGIDSEIDQASIVEALSYMQQNQTSNPAILKLINGSARLRDVQSILSDLRKESRLSGFEVLEEAILADYAQQHDPRYKVYEGLAKEAVEGTDIQQAGTFQPRGAEVQEQLKQAILTKLSGGTQSFVDAETGKRLTEDEIKELQTKLLMTRHGEDGKITKLFQSAPDTRLMFNYSNPNGTDPFAAIIYPVVDGKVRKIIVDDIQNLQDLAIEGQIATKPYIQAASEFVKRASSTNWTNSRHNGVYVDISEKGTSGDFNFFLEEAGLAFKATTDEGLFKFIDDMKELNSTGVYTQEQIRALALKEGPTYGVRPISGNESSQYVRNLEQKQKIMGKRWTSSTVTGSSVIINPPPAPGSTTTTNTTSSNSTSNPGTVVITNPNGTEYVSTIKPATAAALAKTESAPGPEGYDSLYGNSQRKDQPFSDIKITDMTLEEVLAFQDINGEYAAWVKKNNPDNLKSTPVGRFQFVGKTLRPLVKELNLDLSQKFSAQLQDLLFEEHIKNCFEGISSIPKKREILKAQWQGFRKLSNPELDAIIKEYS